MKYLLCALACFGVFSINACSDNDDPCSVHSSEDNLTDDERDAQCGGQLAEVPESEIYTYAEKPVNVATKVEDSTPADPVKQYQRAALLTSEALNTIDEYQKADRLVEAIRLYLLAAREMPREVSSDLKQTIDALFAIDSLMDSNFGTTSYGPHGEVLKYLLEAWDEGVDTKITRPLLNRYMRANLAIVRRTGFNPALRYRDEDEAKRSYKQQFPACHYIVGEIVAIYEITRRLQTSDAKLWKRHNVDLLTTDNICEGNRSNVDEEAREAGYHEYIEMNLIEDAQRVSREAAAHYLSKFAMGHYSDFSGKVFPPPGDSMFFEKAKMWLERITNKATRLKLIRYQARHTESFKEFKTASILYEMLGDSVNTRRMRMLAEANLSR
ncbi:MAG TPA: hypothetical protein VJC12_02340 [Candidatus Paceibacterota bacterium]